MKENHSRDGADLLQVWMGEKGYSQRSAAQLFGVHESLISHLLARRRGLSLPVANRIAELTGGAVPQSSWTFPQDGSATGEAA
jgi:plasmid maintenance system antidote protein VapI